MADLLERLEPLVVLNNWNGAKRWNVWNDWNDHVPTIASRLMPKHPDAH